MGGKRKGDIRKTVESGEGKDEEVWRKYEGIWSGIVGVCMCHSIRKSKSKEFSLTQRNRQESRRRDFTRAHTPLNECESEEVCVCVHTCVYVCVRGGGRYMCAVFPWLCFLDCVVCTCVPESHRLCVNVCACA